MSGENSENEDSCGFRKKKKFTYTKRLRLVISGCLDDNSIKVKSNCEILYTVTLTGTGDFLGFFLKAGDGN